MSVFIETVILSDEAGRKTICVSSQAGCPLGCAFCQTGQLGFSRNLSAAEIVEQYFAAEFPTNHTKAHEKNISRTFVGDTKPNIVFMGMGEPLLNFDAVKKAILLLTHKDGASLSARRVTVSTAGIVEGICRLADELPHVRLAVSLPSCDEELRTRLMPALKTQTLSELKKAILYWKNTTGKRCTIEAALFSRVNTGASDMKRLAAFARETGAHVNLIPWNPVPVLPFSRPEKDELQKALATLKDEGVNATFRVSRGGSVAGACGQLGAR